MPASGIGAAYTGGRRPKAAKEGTRGGWYAENAAHSAMGIWLARKVSAAHATAGYRAAIYCFDTFQPSQPRRDTSAVGGKADVQPTQLPRASSHARECRAIQVEASEIDLN